MVVPRKVASTGSNCYVSYPAASRIACGAVVALSSATAGAETVYAAETETSILGIAGNRPEGLPKGKYDGFFETYEQVPIIDDIGYALVRNNSGDYDIDVGDFLEVCVCGDGTPGGHGILEEAGTHAGTVFTIATVAKALQSVTMGSKSYKVPASSVAVGATSATMVAGEIATMGIGVGDYIYIEDDNGAGMVNRVASLTSTVIGFEIPATNVCETGGTDTITRLYQCLVKLVK
ncbi:MAG: hypothetical protein WC343_09625 [Bacilli bacterium]|jgi:hypothetical protein